jgi:adenosyl cobinamide kinase/adenosyl cobinamide phosphate guanylyltransferase
MDPVTEKNLARWKADAQKREERQRQLRESIVQALTSSLGRAPFDGEVKQRIKVVLKERRAKWLLQNCRTTIEEIVDAHKKS